MRASFIFKGLALSALTATALFGASHFGLDSALAEAGKPTDGALYLQEAATPTATELRWLHDVVMIIITAIVALVTGLMAFIFIRFNKKANPVPSRTSHNTLLEVVWTAAPVAIVLTLIAIATQPLYNQDVIPETEMTVKVVGNQWNWTYVYPDHGDFDFTSSLLPEEDAKAQGRPYLLAADEAMVVPAKTKIRVLVTASDVLHSFAMPSFAVKIDAVPGRINETWFVVDEPGTYYGQCSEICGREHAFMPIEIKVVPQNEFVAWVQTRNPEYAAAPATQQDASLTPAATGGN
ncbi:cytochrome c oxidase subunit II [Robiginitomaculum antarcticum]|uniref:cytochrome c oxidase subunit II n=1 Tax=Robiginitomaculum antarcticum TaxID=437507 RepID=UPI000364A935|nr:cytochrome c oxidase subunit II [Robiginitomaculum antarcticum]